MIDKDLKTIETEEVKHSAKLIGVFYATLLKHGLSEEMAFSIVEKHFYEDSNSTTFEIVDWFDDIE